MTTTRILVADDEKDILVSCRKLFEFVGYEVATAMDGSEALKLLKASRFDLMFVDLKMPGLSGLETLSLARALDPTLIAVMFTAYATLDTAVEAVKRGAFDYLAKPFTAEQLKLVAERALEHKQLVEENLNLKEQLSANLGFEKILGTSDAMRKMFTTLQKVMRSDANILLQGETGTGKELVARTIHAHSFRREQPFIAVDCAALPENLLESELFGHEKGAFTGADKSRSGLLEVAHTGTLFLDEVGELTYVLQAKLLRTLQEREFRRLGSDRIISINIRVIAATSRDLRAEIANKAFREELYYRLNVVNLQLPSLKERKEDIALLANHFLRSFSQQYHRLTDSISPEVIDLFLAYHWPGNVRELQNVIQYAVLLTDNSSIGIPDLPDFLKSQFKHRVSFQSMRERQAEIVAKPFLIELLKRHSGNIARAAEEAKMTRKMVYRMAKKFDIDLEQFRQ